MAIIRLENNKQIKIALKYPAAKPQTPRNGGGVEFLYTLQNGDAMFLPAMAHEEIQSLRPAAGEPFLLSKTIGEGGAAVWAVERIPEVPTPKPVAAARSIAGSNTVAPPPSLTTRESIRIFNQLVATIQAAQAAEEFAKSIGREVRFDAADIRSMAISGFIEQSRRAA